MSAPRRAARPVRATVFGLVALLVGLATHAGPALAQDWSALTREFAGGWQARDAASLQRLMAPALTLLVEGKEYLGVTPRQAAARIAPVLEGYPAQRPGLIRAGMVEGEPGRAFAEFTWAPDAGAGTGRGYILFLGLRLLDGEWRLVELRILR